MRSNVCNERVGEIKFETSHAGCVCLLAKELPICLFFFFNFALSLTCDFRKISKCYNIKYILQ